MTTQSIKTLGADSLLASKSSNISVQKDSNSNFGKVLENNLKTKSNSTGDTESTKDASNNGNSSSAVEKSGDTKTNESVVKDTTVATTKDDVTEVTSKDNTTKVDSQNDTTEADSDETVENSFIENLLSALLSQNSGLKVNNEEVKGFLDKLQTTVQDSLGISKEQLENAMETLGLTMIDLLNPDNLKQLVLQVNGTNDISSLLTDENLANTLNNLLNAVETLKTDSGITLSDDDLTNLINQMQEDPEVNAKVSVPVDQAEENSKTATASDSQKEITIEVVNDTETNLSKSEADTSHSSNQDTNMEQTSPVNSFIQNLTINGNDNTMSFSEQVANVRQMQNIVNQIVEQVKVVIKPEQSSMEIQLNPESLGKINLSVVSKDGILTAQFTTQNELTKQAIENQLQVLKENLNNQGLKVESIEVTVSNFDFNGNSQTAESETKEQKNQSNRQFINADSEDYTGSEDTVIIDENSISISGGSIDYTA